MLEQFDEAGPSSGHLFEVVQHEEYVAVTQDTSQSVQR